MSDKSTIEWTEATWNPVTGCTKVSQGCKNCYAETMWKRLSAPNMPYAGLAFTNVQCHPDRLDKPLRWKKPRRIFVNSMSDLFHEDVPDEFIDQVFAVMGTCKWHTFQLLTKRPARMLEWFSERWQPATEATQRDTYDRHLALAAHTGIDFPPFVLDSIGEDRQDQVIQAMELLPFCTDPDQDSLYAQRGQSNLISQGWPLPNVWLGVSVEDQETFEERHQLLLNTPAAVRWLSMEPLLGPVDIDFNAINIGLEKDGYGNAAILGGIDWVVVGGESGPKARPFNTDWALSIVEQCSAAGVPCFVKQLGGHVIQGGERRIKKHKKGADMSEWPHELRVREYPA